MYAANGFISTIFPNYAQKGVRKYVKTKSEPITVEMLREEAANWVVQDGENPGAWSMFVLEILQKMKWDYNITMQYLLQISKEQFDFVCEAIDEVVYSFQRSEMVDLIETLYHKFCGESTETDLYRDTIAGLRDCIKNQ